MSSLSFAIVSFMAAAVVLVLCLTLFLTLGRGRYADALAEKIGRSRKVRERAMSWYTRDLQKTNPLAARALAKIARVTGDAPVHPGEAALAVLTAAERRAYLETFGSEAAHPRNRAERRRLKRSRAKPVSPTRH